MDEKVTAANLAGRKQALIGVKQQNSSNSSSQQQQRQQQQRQHTARRRDGDVASQNSAYCAQWGGVGDGVGSYFRGRPRDKWRRFTNSASSTIQNDPKSSSQRTKHLWSDRLVRIAFYTPIRPKKEKDHNQVRSSQSSATPGAFIRNIPSGESWLLVAQACGLTCCY